jgi:hypothetical protein
LPGKSLRNKGKAPVLVYTITYSRQAIAVVVLLRRTGWLFVGVALGVAWSSGEAQTETQPTTPATQHQAILKEFSAAARVLWEEPTDQQRQDAAARAEKLPAKLLELAQNHPKDAVALEALIQVVTIEYWLNIYTSHPGWGKDSQQAKAIALMLRDHLDSDKLGEACKRVQSGFRQECETFLRTVLEKSPHREVQGAACLRLAQFLSSRLERLDLLKDQPELTRRYEDLYGKDYLDALRQQDRAKVIKDAEKFYEQARDKYHDVKLPYDEMVGETATTELFEIQHLAVGQQPQDIAGVDQDGQQFKVSDYRGKVVLLYFWSEF